jgi:branched-chain amino acid aminotransferase
MNGITRQKVIDLCQSNNIPCFQKNFSLYDVYSADEAFVTGTFGGLTPVNSIDGKAIKNQSDFSFLKQLNDLYEELIVNESKS